MPSLNEVMEGLTLWHSRQIESLLANVESKNVRIKIIKNSKRNFSTIFQALDFTPEEMNKPIGGHFDPILGLYNPYSKVTCLILYLYSMEVGTPQLFAEANRVSRDMDLDYLVELGPFLRALM